MIAIDPVCKMKVDTETAKWTYEYEGETYYFCAPGCMHSFSKEPEKYLANGGDDHGHMHHDHDHDHDHHGH